MTTETVTVVFTDLVGSTELLSRVGEVAADALRREHFGLLRSALEVHGGREVKNLGDGLMVVFDGVTAALDAAVAMQQAITARPPDGEPLAIRVGVAVGEAEREDGDYFGLPVVEAARLSRTCGRRGDPLDRVREAVGSIAQRCGARGGGRAGAEGPGRAGRDVPGPLGALADRGGHVGARATSPSGGGAGTELRGPRSRARAAGRGLEGRDGGNGAAHRVRGGRAGHRQVDPRRAPRR